MTGLLLGLLLCVSRAADLPHTNLRFEVSVARNLPTEPRDGRLLIVIGKKSSPEPRRSIGRTGLNAPPLLGADANSFGPGSVARVDEKAVIFPIPSLASLPAGEYFIQAVFHANRDLNVANAPGNLYSDPVKVKLDPSHGEMVRLELAHVIPWNDIPADQDNVRYIKLRSELLSAFHGRPMFLRAAVILPREFDKET
ncbi:MAG: hypothetical protein ACRD36_14470, partial [Candidatus Acidiferrum sp.]